MARYGKLCIAGAVAFVLVYLAAFGFAVIGTRGLFGVEPNNMAAIWLILLGMPWTLLLAALPADGLELFGRLFIALAPLLNLWLATRTCRRRRRRRQ